MTWNFTEASYGKGAPDGVGGALKNLADRMVAYGKEIPDTHALMENLFKQTSVKLFGVTEEKIKTSGESVLEQQNLTRSVPERSPAFVSVSLPESSYFVQMR